MKRSKAEQAMGQLFDDIVEMLDIVEKHIYAGEGELPEGVEQSLEEVWEAVCELRRRDKAIRKDLGINEESFQASIAGKVGLDKFRRRLVERIDKLDKDLAIREERVSEELRIAGESEPPGQREEAPQKAEPAAATRKRRKRSQRFRRAGGDDKWKPL